MKYTEMRKLEELTYQEENTDKEGALSRGMDFL